MSEKKADTSNLLNQVTSLVKTTTALAGQDIGFQSAVDNTIQESVDQAKHKIINIINDLFLNVNEHNDILDYSDEFSLNDSWKQIGDVLDSVLEKSDKYIDDIKREQSTTASEKSLQYLDDSVGSRSNENRKRISKPQLYFKTPVDNSENSPFKPLLNDKPFALKSLEESLVLVPSEENVPEHYNNPYEYEIMNQEYNSNILEQIAPVPSKDWASTTGKWIATVDDLSSMTAELKNYTEIAIDLEHHSLRSYYGITCLMQISTRDQDYIVDTIALRDDLQKLNEVFCNPSITKVLHGAFMDIIWLQRDLGLYIVGLFDTYHASKALGFPKHGLAYLLETFANFKTSKKYQLADWRIRPLTPPLLAYARSDTHFLLNIFDQLRNKLVEQDKLKQVLYASRNVARRRFEYSRFRPKSLSEDVYCTEEKLFPWRSLMNNYNIPFELEPLVVSLFEWRDVIARREDESPAYIMPNQMLVTLVSAKPTEAAGVLSISNMVSDYMRTNAKTLANIIKNALKTISEDTKSKGVLGNSSINGYGKDSTDQTKIVSRETVAFVANILDELKSSLQSNETGSHLLSGVSHFFQGDAFWNNEAVLYDNAGKHIIAEQELMERKVELSEAFEKDAELPEIATEVQNTLTSTISVDPTAAVVVAAPEIELPEPKVRENKDEVVVLKSRKPQAKRKQPSKDGFDGDDVVPIDYASSKKVMDSSDNKNKFNKKKRSFNPYGVENEGPQGYNKKHKPNQGKNVSFKNRK